MGREGGQERRGFRSGNRARGDGTRQEQEFTGKGRAPEGHFIGCVCVCVCVCVCARARAHARVCSGGLCSLCGQEEAVDSVSETLNLYSVKWRRPSRQLARNLEVPEWESRLKINSGIFCF